MTQFLIFYSCHISWNKINKKNIYIHEPISAYRSKHRFPTTLKSPFLPPPSLRKPNHRCPVTLHRPPQFFTTLSPPPDNKRYHHPSFTFFFFSLSFNLLHPCLDTFARVTQRPLNPRRSIKLEREVEAPPSLSLSLSPFLPLPGGFSSIESGRSQEWHTTLLRIRIDRGELYIRISSGYLVIRDTWWPALGYGRVVTARTRWWWWWGIEAIFDEVIAPLPPSSRGWISVSLFSVHRAIVRFIG